MALSENWEAIARTFGDENSGLSLDEQIEATLTKMLDVLKRDAEPQSELI